MNSQEIDSSHIIIKNLGHTYKNGKCALRDVNLEIGTGIFGLLGSNGAGKSTLMRIICTLLEPSKGQVLVNGHDVTKNRNQVRSILGYLPQEFGAWRLQKVEEVLDILATLSGVTDKKVRSNRIEKVLESVGLAEVADRKVKQLSGGMLRRLGVAQALVHDPKILIMDEPTVGLDPEERQRFRQLMAELARDRTILLSTHIVSDLGTSCSDMALIDQGQVEYRGSPSGLIAKAHGLVYEVSLSASAAQELELDDGFEIVSRSYVNGQNVLRGVTKESSPPDGARTVGDINLEEAYLAFTLNRGLEKAQIKKQTREEEVASVV